MANYWQQQREKLDISQRQCAILLGVSNTTLSIWEKGDAIPDLSRAKKLAEVFGVSPSTIEREIVNCHREQTALTAA